MTYSLSAVTPREGALRLFAFPARESEPEGKETDVAHEARIHIAELQGTRNTSRRCAWLSAPGHIVRSSGMAELDITKAALGGSAI